MRNNDLKIGAAVYWYVGPMKCDGCIIDIYNRRAKDGMPMKERVLLIEMLDGKKVVKLEDTVIVMGRQNYG